MPDERKLVTVVFADVVGSTGLSEALDPERLRSVLDTYFDEMSAVIAEWGGTVEKFIGDAVVAVFGVPVVREDDASRALHAALQMLDRLGELNTDLHARHNLTLEIRIGVESGDVLAAADPGRDQRLVSGEIVNTAARLQAAATAGSVLVGARAWSLCRAAFEFAEPEHLELRGKSHPVPVRRLLRALPEPRRGIAGLQAPLIGRTAELQLLLTQAEEAFSSAEPRLVTILGQAGVGKSRLVHEFVEAAAAVHPAVVTLRGRCLAAGRGITYWALGEILRSLSGIALDDAAPTAAAKLTDCIRRVLGVSGVSDPEIEAVLGAIALSAGITVAGAAPTSPENVAEELARAWPRLLSALCVETPMILLFEDVHWAGEDMVAMLERLVSRARGRLLILATARPEFSRNHPGFGGGSDEFATLSLRTLSERQTAELLTELLEGAELPADVSAAIGEKTGGNPYFVEEVVQRLIESGALAKRDGRWMATAAAAEVPLPDSLQGVLTARLDALPAAEKKVVQAAAIIGKVFWEGPLTRLAGVDHLAPALLELERRGLIFAQLDSAFSGQQQFSFRHMTLRDVAYASVPKAQRARTHAAVAEWLVGLSRDRREEFLELIAHHLEAAATGDGAELAWPDPNARDAIRRQAFEALLVAGDTALRRSAVVKAVELHQRAQAVAASAGERLAALEAIGVDHDAVYRGEDAVAAFEAALALVEPDDRPARARLLWRIADCMATTPGAFKLNPDGAEADRLVDEGLAIADDPLSRARLLVARGDTVRLWSGGVSEFGALGAGHDPLPIEARIDCANEGLAIARTLGDAELIWRAQTCLVNLYMDAGRELDALELVTSQLQHLAQLDQITRADTLRYAGLLEVRLGRLEPAAEHAFEARRVAQGTSPHHRMHMTALGLQVLYEAGRWDEMEPLLEEHLAAFEEDPAVICGAVRDGPVFGSLLGLHRGQAERSEALAKLVPDPAVGPRATTAWRSMLELERGNAELALRISVPTVSELRDYAPLHVRVALEALAQLGRWDELDGVLQIAAGRMSGFAALDPVCARVEGRRAAAAGDLVVAASQLRRAVTRFDELGLAFEAARTRERLAEVVAGDERTASLRAALATYERLRAQPHLERLRGTFV